MEVLGANALSSCARQVKAESTEAAHPWQAGGRRGIVKKKETNLEAQGEDFSQGGLNSPEVRVQHGGGKLSGLATSEGGDFLRHQLL